MKFEQFNDDDNQFDYSPSKQEFQFCSEPSVMSDDDDQYDDLYGEKVKQSEDNVPRRASIQLDNLTEESRVSTEQYLNDTIGDVISELLEEVARESPPDPVMYLAGLLEKYIIEDSLEN